MNVYISNNIYDEKIINFIRNDNHSEIYHHPAWLQAVSEATDSKYNYLLVEENNSLNGLIPFAVKNHIINSLPFTTHCKPLLPKQLNLKSLLSKINELLPDVHGFSLKFREDDSAEFDFRKTEYLNHIIYLKENIEEFYNSLGRRSIRRFIRKSYENGLILRFGKTEEDLKIFYALECKLRKNIGLPPAPFKFFHSLWEYLSKHNLILLPIVEFNSIPIASSIILIFKNRLYFEYTAIDKKYINLYPNHFLHWEIIKLAHKEYGVRIVDLGRTCKQQQGLIYFKENWNARGIPLVEFSDQPSNNLKSRAIFNSFKKINKHLPLWMLKLEGHVLFNNFEKH